MKFCINMCCVIFFIIIIFFKSLCFPQADRLRRMMGEEVGTSAAGQIHMSADDLNDGFILDKEDKKTLAYQVRELDYVWNIPNFPVQTECV